MKVKRRDFINLSALVASGVVTGISSCTSIEKANEEKIMSNELQSLTKDVVPISVEERKSRIEKAQRLLAEQNIGALLLDCGTSLLYFTGISWWPSERTMVAIIPAKGEVRYVCPAFEEDRLREQVIIGKDISIWQEDESPYQQIATVFKNAGIVSGSIAMEERLRF